jgi:hypothetical protein
VEENYDTLISQRYIPIEAKLNNNVLLLGHTDLDFVPLAAPGGAQKDVKETKEDEKLDPAPPKPEP